MGQSISSLFDYFFGKEHVRILMVGLDAAGKTTILFKMKLGEVITTIPTIGFNVDTLEYKNISFTVWDVGGQKRIRAMWRYYFTNTQAIIYVVDSSDVQRFAEASEELHAVLEDDNLRDAVLLVFANKQDLPNAATPSELAKHLNLHKLKQTWHIHGTCATNGQGLYEGLETLRTMLRERKRKLKF